MKGRFRQGIETTFFDAVGTGGLLRIVVKIWVL
jgi:hypothetical protein